MKRRSTIGLAGASVGAALLLTSAQGCSGSDINGGITGCGPGTELDGGTCVATSSPSEGDGTLADAASFCGTGTVFVGGVCVATSVDSGSSTAITCGPGTTLDGSACVPTGSDADAGYCAAGTHVCSGQCYADDDPTVCGDDCTPCPGTAPTCAAGACVCTPTSCGAGFTCSGGACVAGACSTLTNCTDGLCCNGTCVEGAECCVDGDCPAPAECQSAVSCSASGQCVYASTTDGSACGTGGTCCAGSCDPLASDKFNCGVCGNICYGGSATASCLSGYCAELVAQASNAGGAPDADQLYAPTLAVDDTNVYFVAPGAGTLLQSPLASLGNTHPQVLVTQNGTGSLHAVSQLLIDPASVYYASWGAPSIAKVAIGGGTVSPWSIDGTLSPTNPSYMTFDGTNVYVGFGTAIGYASRNGGTLTSLTPLGGGAVVGGIASDGVYLYFPVKSAAASSTYTIDRYNVGASTLATLATGEAQPQAFAIGNGAAYWSQAASPFAIRTAPLDLSGKPSTFETSLTTAASTLSVDPSTGDVYWVEGGSGTGNGQAGPLKKVTGAGTTPIVVMASAVWGTPAFDGSNVYYVMTIDGGQLVQVWRSPN